jgi:hypothetical protein
MRIVYKVLVGRLEGKRPLGRSIRRWEYKSIMDLRDMGCEVMGWIHLAQERDQRLALVIAVMNIRVP